MVTSLEFCPKCGKLLRPSGDKKTLVCPKCGFIKTISDDSEASFTEEIEHDLKKELIGSEVIDESEINATLPTKILYCPNCNKKTEVMYWQRQTRSADEAPTRFFRCTVCGHTWREYD